MEQPTAPTNSALRPRWSVWLRSLGGILILPLGVLATALTDSTHGRDWAVPVWSYFVLFPLWLAADIWREYRRRPPVLRYWEDDTKIALTVRELKTGRIVLQSRDASLANQNLSLVPLAKACLSDVDLRGADLSGNDLSGADLRRALLMGAKLQRAKLCGANLESASLGNADLREADLRRARLASVVLSQADLRGADLRGADFIGRSATLVLWDKELGGAQFTGALYDAATRWPLGFDYIGRGCLLATSDAVRLPIPATSAEAGTEQLPLPASTPR